TAGRRAVARCARCSPSWPRNSRRWSTRSTKSARPPTSIRIATGCACTSCGSRRAASARARCCASSASNPRRRRAACSHTEPMYAALASLQGALADIYDLPATPDVDPFLLTDRAAVARVHEARDSDEQLIVAQEDDGIALALYIDAAVL